MSKGAGRFVDAVIWMFVVVGVWVLLFVALTSPYLGEASPWLVATIVTSVYVAVNFPLGYFLASRRAADMEASPWLAAGASLASTVAVFLMSVPLVHFQANSTEKFWQVTTHLLPLFVGLPIALVLASIAAYAGARTRRAEGPDEDA